MKTGIFILSSKSRKSQLKNCLYFLFKNYNKTFNHDVFIMTPDYDDEDKDEISLSIRENNRSCINFKDINLKTPDNLDMDKVSKIISCEITSNWGDINDRNKNHFWMFDFWNQIGHEFDYVMKMDDDVIIEEPLKEDLFKIIDNRALNILFCTLTTLCSIGTFGMKNFLIANFQSETDKINQYMTSTKIADTNTIQSFKTLHKTVFDKDYPHKEVELFQPIVPSDSLMIIRTSFYTGDKFKPFLKKIEELKYTYYLKWSIGLVLPLLSVLITPDKVTRTLFNISKETHRYVLKNENRKILNHVPSDYSHTGCVSST